MSHFKVGYLAREWPVAGITNRKEGRLEGLEPIRERRLEAGVSQAGIARAAGRSLNWAFRVEHGVLRPSREDAEKVGRFLGVPAEELFTRIRDDNKAA